MKNREHRLAIESIKIGAIVGLVSSLLAAHTGDGSAYQVAQVQPMKLASMEALYKGGTDQSLTGVALVNPFQQPDYLNEDEPPLRIAVPYALSFLATHDIHGELSLEEKIQHGRVAIESLSTYRKAKKENNTEGAAIALKSLKENIPYFGYGYVKSVDQLIPYIPVCFWAFRIMVGLGCLFILLFALATFFVFKKNISDYKWLLIASIICVPLAYIASESGWIVAEMGRQPWTIQDMLPTWAAVSDVNSNSVALTFFIFLILFTTMLAVEISILLKQIKKGPENSVNS